MKRALPAAALATLILFTGCSSADGTGAAEPPAATKPAAAAQPTAAAKPTADPSPEYVQITTAPGTVTWNEQVVKNLFFDAVEGDCSDLQTYTDSTAYESRIACEEAVTYMWFFEDTAAMEAYMPVIVSLGLPMLVSETWVIASLQDLEAGQEKVGGAINRP